MKVSNTTLIASPQSMGSSFVLEPIYLGNIVNYSIQLVFTGTPVGTFKLQCSNDLGKSTLPGKVAQSDTVTHWTDVGGSDVAVTTASNHAYNVQNCGYLWVRVVYTATSSTGSLTIARITIKGA